MFKHSSGRTCGLLLLLLGTALLTACPKQTTISQLQNDPRQRNREVALVGRVVNSFGALNFGAYELDDETGRIWVLTERGVPSKGARVVAIGRFRNGLTWQGKNYASALQETDRKIPR